MKHCIYTKRFIILLLVIITGTLSAQINPFWNTNGNTAANGDFIGTNNNEPLIFKTNGLEALRIKPNGDIRISAFQNMGKGLIFANNNGVLNFTAFPNDTNLVFAGSGNFKSISALSGWTRTGNVLYNLPGVNVGIGVTNPTFPLEVNGSAMFYGVVHATGVVLAAKMEVDTLKTADMFSLNNNIHMSAGLLNQFYTTSGDLRIQSNSGNTYNTIFHAGVGGNVGIGTYSPAYKLDVIGPVRFANDVYVSKLRPLPGDTLIIIGDSSLYFSGNKIYTSAIGNVRGLGLGSNTAQGYGLNSVAIGQKVRVDFNVNNAVVIGTGVLTGTGILNNTIPNSLMIGFNSDKPTMFIAPASGAGTFGKVGFGTTSPDALFQVNTGTSRITMDDAGTNMQGFTSYIGFNAHRDPNTGWYKFRGDGTQTNAGSLILQDAEGALRFYVETNNGTADKSVDPIHTETQSILTLRKDRVQIGSAILSPTSPYNNGFTKLTVDGRIMSKDLIVSDVDWQDEVFDSTYTLMPLDSVASYIAKHKHLPGVKPEAEVEQNGMSVTETVTMQQQKIEELTLYIILLNERIKAIEAEKKKLKDDQTK